MKTMKQLTKTTVMMVLMLTFTGITMAQVPPSSGGGGGGGGSGGKYRPHMQMWLGGVQQTVVAGQKDVLLAWINCANRSIRERNIVSLPLNILTEGDVELSNFRLYAENRVQILTLNDPDANIHLGFVRFDIDPNGFPQIVDAGKKLAMYVTYDVGSSTADGATIQARLRPNKVVFDPRIKVRPAQPQLGSMATVRQHGELFVGLDANSPPSQLLPSLTEDIIATEIVVVAEFENIVLEALPIYFGKLNGGGPDQVTRVRIYDGSTLLAEAWPTTTDAWPDKLVPINTGSPLMWFDVPLIILSGTDIRLTIKVRTSNCVSGPGQSGQGFTIVVPGDKVEAHGLMSGYSIQGQGTAVSNEFHLFRGVPIVNVLDLDDNFLYGGRELQKRIFSLQIIPDGPLGETAQGRLSFNVQTEGGVTASSFRVWFQWFWGYTEVGSGVLDENGDVVVDFYNPIIVQSASFERFDLLADVFTPGGPTPDAYMAVRMLGDSGFTDPLPCTPDEAEEQGYFIWHDLTVVDTDVGVDLASANGYRVLMENGNILPLISEVMYFSR